MSNKAQKLVNEIYKFYSLDVSSLSGSEIEDLASALNELKDLNKEDVESPARSTANDDFFDDEDEELEELNFEEAIGDFSEDDED